MKGIINKGIQEIVTKKFGVDAWARTKEIAGCQEIIFLTYDDYPDEMTIALIEAAAKVSGLTPDEVQFQFGQHWALNTGPQAYQTYFQVAGTDPREVLLNVDRIHRMATRNIPNANPPQFTIEECDDGRLLMHYRSLRQLCPTLKGLIHGVGLYFGQELRIKELTCTRTGAAECIMEVTFP